MTTKIKYKNGDKNWFIAQHLLVSLPKELKNIVKETKNRKDEDETFVSISYMKVNLIFWGALQEKMHKVEHLGNRLFEAEDEIKALEGGE